MHSAADPSDIHGSGPGAPRRPRLEHEGLVLLRTGSVGCALLAAYYTLPIDSGFGVGTVVALVLGLALVLALRILVSAVQEALGRSRARHEEPRPEAPSRESPAPRGAATPRT